MLSGDEFYDDMTSGPLYDGDPLRVAMRSVRRGAGGGLPTVVHVPSTRPGRRGDAVRDPVQPCLRDGVAGPHRAGLLDRRGRPGVRASVTKGRVHGRGV